MEQSKTQCANRKRPHGDYVADLSEFSLSVLNEIKELFNKKFTFQKLDGNQWTLPEAHDVHTGQVQWSEKLKSLKESLNDVKNQLSDKDLEKWHEHTSFTNWAGKVIPHVRRAVNAELCTQAWCKFHEILCTFPLLPVKALQDGELNSVHLCEAPGAFITSLNHYLRSNHILCDWNWVANTLNPYHEGNDTGMMIMDDRLIAGTLSWWYFGPDDTGDVMDREYLEGLTEFTRNMKSIHLVTADGSVDCQENPGEQEALVAPLHYCEAITALRLLSPGGSLVLKMFTLFERCSAHLLYLLNCCFQEVHVFKPGTSKAGNSEVYAVCLGYGGRATLGPHLERLEGSFGPQAAREWESAGLTLPPSFLGQLEDCCALFHGHQTATIRENLRLFGGMSPQEVGLLVERRECAASYYLRHFGLRPLPRDAWVLRRPGRGLAGRLFTQRRKQHAGSYNERQELARQGWLQRVRRGYLGPVVDTHWGEGPLAGPHLLEGAEEPPACGSWYVLEGRRLSRLASSPFCEPELLRSLNEALAAGGGCPPPLCAACSFPSLEQLLWQLSHLQAGPLDCLVVGIPAPSPAPRGPPGLLFRHCHTPPPPAGPLHDGDPCYQRWLLSAVLRAATESAKHGAVLLPLLSSFTRFTAGLIFALWHCFRALSFTCPGSPGQPATLLCVGFRRPPTRLLEFLQELSHRLEPGPDPEPPQQVLQFVPMELLLGGPLPEFLGALNLAVAKYRLHLAIQAAT
ncbi:LOW QUALITY PROTEIN: cap-specific mRNA (nucleoside-2'-O-)-methyltransferase 2-like [Pristis pectinata]|uniref:LOW QUALITY PROTEIN: cap-specific mRNA (nucleoside-2'-O-)-methyltransferase 2-like n=1 Tax=Pristis pectinata TaxID=685728 RepID=UPI00223D46A2|nr:LOW QUALITY PROTEIN: cap-specific mRNA (nucleoside-2'-O-)-methyltransferase 2-like [Pristis pectinata]